MFAFATSASAQQPIEMPAVASDDSVGRNDDLTPEYLAQIDSLMLVYEKEKAARELIKKIENQQIEAERKFDFSSTLPILSGTIHTLSQRGYLKQEALFESHNVTAPAYIAALSPLAVNWALKAAGVRSRSSARRMATANLITFALVEGLGQGLKYATHESRPDMSDKHSMPSIHSALAFASATVLSREYGHLSPWVTVGSYMAAAGTQFIDIKSNNHWLLDTFIGSGIGVLSANLGYFLTDKIFYGGDITVFELRKRDLLRMQKMFDRPSGFIFTSGSEFGNRMLDVDDRQVKLASCLSAGVEASWFITKNFAVEAIASLAESQAKVLTNDDEGYFTGDNLAIYHFNVGAKLSTPLTLPSRASVRALLGVRNTSKMTFERDDISMVIPANTCFELGCGFSYDAIDMKNHSVGVGFDYRHAFAPNMKNRYSLYTVYKILF